MATITMHLPVWLIFLLWLTLVLPWMYTFSARFEKEIMQDNKPRVFYVRHDAQAACSQANDTRPVVFAADNLPDGRIYLYSHHSVWQLYLVQIGITDNTSVQLKTIVEHEEHRYATIAIPLDAKQAKRLVSKSIEAFHSIVSNFLSPSQANMHNKQGTFLLEVPKHYYHWYLDETSNHSGVITVQDTPEVVSSKAVFTLHFSGRQVMFVDIGSKLYYQDIAPAGPGYLLKLSMEGGKYSLGKLPKFHMAAFAIEFLRPNGNAWVVLIECTRFCVVPLVANKIRFDMCNMSSIGDLMNLDHKFGMQNNLAQGIEIVSQDGKTRFKPQNDLLVVNITTIQWFQQNISLPNASWRVFNLDLGVIFFSLLFSLFLFAIVFYVTYTICVNFLLGHSYNVAKNEASNIRRELEQAGRLANEQQEQVELS